jgi:hypothetical protein
MILFNSKIKMNYNQVIDLTYFLLFRNSKLNSNILKKHLISIRKIQIKKLKKIKFLIRTPRIDTNI